MAYKNNNRKINTLARKPTRGMFTNYETFKTNIQQVFGDIEQQNMAKRELRHLKQLKLASEYTAKFQ
jgi:hypothetical protein